MKTNLISEIERYTKTTNKVWAYLRPDGRNATVTPVLKQSKPISESSNAYFKPFECVPYTVKPESAGEKIDFRFG